MPDNYSSILNETDAYWIVLIIVGIVMFLSSAITIVVLCFLWRRHRKRLTQVNTQIPMQINNRPLPNYETQVCIKILFWFFFMKEDFSFLNRKWKYLYHSMKKIQLREI
jgi:hypothetical protein